MHQGQGNIEEENWMKAAYSLGQHRTISQQYIITVKVLCNLSLFKVW